MKWVKKSPPTEEQDKDSGDGRPSVGLNIPPPLNFYGKRMYESRFSGRIVSEIQELVNKVLRIEGLCNVDVGGEAEETDEFMRMKRDIYNLIMVTKNLIREKYMIQQEQGNTLEAIQKSSQINRNIERLNQEFFTLKEVFKRQTKKTNKGVSAEDLDTRFDELQIIKRQIEDCRELAKRGIEYNEEEIITLTDFLTQMEDAGMQPPPQFDTGTGGWREPSPEEQSIMERWGARDKDFDEQIWQVGEVVDRLNVVATTIGQKAEEQGKMALELSRQADEANAEVIEVNAKLKSLISSGNGLNFCCKLMLTLILMTLLGTIAQNITARIRSGFLPVASPAQAEDSRLRLAMQGVVKGTNISWEEVSRGGIIALDKHDET